MFGSLLRRETPIEIDSAFGDRQALRVRHQLEAGDTESVVDAYHSAADSNTSGFLLSVIADWMERPSFIDAWADAEPHNGVARLVSGAHAVNWAWQARSYSRAEDVSDENWGRFYERLQFASEELAQAADLLPSDPNPLAYRLRCGRGQSWDLRDTTHVYENSYRLDPLNWWCAYEYFANLCQKWHGSHEDMFDFARACSRTASDGSDLHALIACAHIERWLFADAFDEDPQADDYWLESSVRNDILDAYELSLASGDYGSSKLERMTGNVFLFCFASMSLRDLMRIEVERIGAYPSVTPWRYLGDPVGVYREIRRLVK